MRNTGFYCDLARLSCLLAELLGSAFGKGAVATMGSPNIRFGLGWAKSHSFHTGQTPVMKYNRQMMRTIMWDRIHIADIVGVEVISLDDVPRGYGEFDASVPKKFVIDLHKLFSVM